MKTFAKLATAFTLAVALTGCVKTPDTTEAALPEATTTLTVQNATASKVLATTQIGVNYLYEIAPTNSPNVTCFMNASIYTGTAVSGDVDCVKKPEGYVEPVNGKAVIESATRIGTNTFYEVTPATRPDLRCYVSSTIYGGTAVSGSVQCLPKNGL